MTLTKKQVRDNGHRNIGVKASPPKEKCDDKKCPWHSNVPLRGKTITGYVVSSKARNTVIIKWDFHKFLPKYEVYERRNSSVAAHNPPCLNAKKGDTVRAMECRPLSKTKSFVVFEVVKRAE